MRTTITAKGQVIVPKPIRDAMHLKPGTKISISIDANGNVVLKKVSTQRKKSAHRFESVRGIADIKWRTDELMRLLRGDDWCWSTKMTDL